MKGVKYYISSGSWLVCEKLVNIIYGVILSVIVARGLGPGDYGTFSVILSVSLMLSFLVGLGGDGVIVKKTVSEKEVSSLYNSIFIIKLLGFAVYFVFYIMILKTVMHGVNDFFVTAIVVSVFFKIFLFYRFYFEAVKDFRVASSGMVLARLAALVYLCVVYYFDFDKKWLVFYLVIEFFMAAVFYKLCFLSRVGYGSKFLGFKKIIIDFLPYTAAAAIYPVFMQVDMVMLGYFSGAEQVGYYSAASQMILPFSFVGFVVISILFPVILKEKNTNIVQKYVDISSQGVVIFTYAFVAFVVLFGEGVVDVVYGDEYKVSGEYVKWLVLTCLFSFPASIYSRMIIYENLGVFGLYKAIFAMLINVFLNFILIPVYGVYGAIISSIFSYFVADLLSYFFLKEIRYVGLSAIRSLFFMNVALLYVEVKRLKNGV